MPYSHQAANLTVDQQHAAILNCCEDLIVVLGEPSRLKEVGLIRMRLASLLQANLQREEAEIFGPIRNLPKGDRPTRFDYLEMKAAELRRRYSIHVGQWNWPAIQAKPDEYADAAKVLIRDVQAHLKTKRSLLPAWSIVLNGSISAGV